MPRIKGLFRSLPYLTQERPPMGGQFNASSSFTSTTKNHATHCNIPCRNSELMAHQPYTSRHRRCQGYAPVFLGIPKIWYKILISIYRLYDQTCMAHRLNTTKPTNEVQKCKNFYLFCDPFAASTASVLLCELRPPLTA